MEDYTCWFHCNKCSLRFQLNIKWFTTNCGHIFCEICAKKMSESGCTCSVCQQNAQLIEINKDMDVNAQQFFTPFEAYLKKTHDTVQKVFSFQMGQTNRLYQVLSQKYAYAKKAYLSSLNKNKALIKENKMLKDIVIANQTRPFSTSTPAVIPNDNMQNDNISDISSIPFTPTVSSVKTNPGYAVRMQAMNFTPNQVYPSAGRYQKPSPAQQHQMSQYNASGRKMAPVHRTMSGPKISMRDLNLGKRT